MSEQICPYHSGHEQRLNALEKNLDEQWKDIDKMRQEIQDVKDKVATRLNQLIIAVAMLALSLLANVLKP
jgi:hypothetical protein